MEHSHVKEKENTHLANDVQAGWFLMNEVLKQGREGEKILLISIPWLMEVAQINCH